MSTTDGWLKLNFASCVIRKTRSLGALVLCSICNRMVFVNYIYDKIADTQFHNNGTLYAPRYEEAFLPKGKKRTRSLRSLGLASL